MGRRRESLPQTEGGNRTSRERKEEEGLVEDGRDVDREESESVDGG